MKNFFCDFWTNKVDGRVFDRCITDFSIAQNLGSVESMVFDYGPKKWRGKTVPSSDGNLLRTYSIIGWKFPFPAYYSEVSGRFHEISNSFQKFPEVSRISKNEKHHTWGGS